MAPCLSLDRGIMECSGFALCVVDVFVADVAVKYGEEGSRESASERLLTL